MITRSYTEVVRDGTFCVPLARLEQRTLDIQLEHFRFAPARRGRPFYALELVGEVGELLNGCKKFVRTSVARRRDRQARTAVPEEAADALIALMLLKLAARNQHHPAPSLALPVRRTVPWLHGCLSELARAAALLYAREHAAPARAAFALGRYRRIVELLLAVARFFRFDLEAAVQAKLSVIVTKVNAGYYD